MIDLEDIEKARRLIDGSVRKTPMVRLSHCKDRLPVAGNVFLKLECLQVTGSFKARGAMNRLRSLPADRLASGIVTASGGNHGIAVARTAHVAGVPACAYLPASASPAKLARIEAWGTEIAVVDGVWDKANEAAFDHSRRTGAVYFHPFADRDVVAGQGTLGIEILEDLPEIDAILVAIGGGGLISGISTALRAKKPDTRIIGVEPVGSPTLKASLDAGHVVELDELSTRVPTMACKKTVGPVFDIVKRNVDEIVLVSDEDMEEAARWLWFETGVAADLSGAASLAALRAAPKALEGAENICALVCGAGAEGTT